MYLNARKKLHAVWRQGASPLGAYSVPQIPSCVVIPPLRTCPLELRISTLNTISWNNTYWLCGEF